MKTHRVLVIDLMTTGVIGTAYDNSSIPGFQTKMVVGKLFQPV